MTTLRACSLLQGQLAAAPLVPQGSPNENKLSHAHAFKQCNHAIIARGDAYPERARIRSCHNPRWKTPPGTRIQPACAPHGACDVTRSKEPWHFCTCAWSWADKRGVHMQEQMQVVLNPSTPIHESGSYSVHPICRILSLSDIGL
ncbi:hypothetical protein B0I35DRAFT_118394 [Stachybotrys elegans]|uniref:Uncharacterized protein n=1 Tax=Stachybotrys elegans TaxID=80388 RepID=A0A8K0WV45_9HYPO|nr:hypothetical protein B0I35DRAFT_118394 [Stachybotrys elegans]